MRRPSNLSIAADVLLALRIGLRATQVLAVEQALSLHSGPLQTSFAEGASSALCILCPWLRLTDSEFEGSQLVSSKLFGDKVIVKRPSVHRTGSGGEGSR